MNRRDLICIMASIHNTVCRDTEQAVRAALDVHTEVDKRLDVLGLPLKDDVDGTVNAEANARSYGL